MRTPTVTLLIVASLVPAAFLAGCVSCDPEPVDATLALELADEEARTLPVLVSGATTLGSLLPAADASARATGSPAGDVSADAGLGEWVLDRPVPDANGYVDVRLNVSHPNVTHLDVRNLQLDITVDGTAIPIRFLTVEGGNAWEETPGGWQGRSWSGDTVRLWWAVDSDRLGEVGRMALAEGDAYAAQVTLDWRHEGCDVRASGHAEQTFREFIQATVNTGAFEAAGAPEVERTDEGLGVRAAVGVKNGLDVRVDRVSVHALLLDGDGSRGVTGVGVFPYARWNVSGGDGDVLTPRDVLHVRSTAPAVGMDAEYAATGLVVPPDAEAKGGFLVIVEVAYEPVDATLGPTTDVVVIPTEA